MRESAGARGKEAPASLAHLASACRRGQELLPERCSLDELADSRLRDELAVLDEHVSAKEYDFGEPVTSVPSYRL